MRIGVMATGVQILLLEDSAHDAELISSELSVIGMDFRLHHVSDRDAFMEALKSSAPDLILSDYSIPHFDGLAALVVAQEMAPEVPFIIVTGSIDEETAVNCMKSGAADYVLKDRLFQLGSSIRGVLEAKRRRTEEKRAEEQLRASLREKEMLLKEVHHRVKNNLQVVSSLLRLQSHHTRNPEAIAALKDCQERIRSMALVHEKIYRARDFSRVDFSEFLRELAPHLMKSFAPDHSAIRLEFDVEKVSLGMEAAIPCALIVNELVSNALKHGFPANQNGSVWIRFRIQPDRKIALTVQDDGVGLPAGLDLPSVQSLGLQLVQTLTMQLRGTLQKTSEKGVGFTVLFSEAA